MSIRRTRRHVSQISAESIGDDLPYLPPTQQRRLTRSSTSHANIPTQEPARRHTMNFKIENQADEKTPRARRRRTTTREPSLAASSSWSISSRRRLKIRPSLMGPQVHEMDLSRRCEIIADVAGDCLVKLLRAGVESSRSRGSSAKELWRGAWESLQTLRTHHIFTAGSSPFPLMGDVISSFHPHAQNTLDYTGLAHALDLSNLATFVYTILNPDEAATMLEGLVDNLDVGGKGKGRARDKAFHEHVDRRNEMLVLAWKRFWLVVVPKSQRASEVAMRLWLDFATQIAITWQQRTIDPPASVDYALRSIPPSKLLGLFSPSSIGRFGQWDITEDWSDADSPMSPEKDQVGKRWAKMVKRRENEIRDIDTADLAKQFPFQVFRQEMLAYVQYEIMGNINTAQLRNDVASAETDEESDSQAVRHAPRLGPDDQLVYSDSDMGDSLEGSPSEHDDIEELDGSFGEQTGSEADFETAPQYLIPSTSQLPALDIVEMGGDPDTEGTGVDVDLLTQAIEEMEEEFAQSGALSVGHSGRTTGDRLQPEEEEGWAVRDAVGSGLSKRVSAPIATRRFNFAARQQDAEKVEWETQTPPPRQADITPRARARSAARAPSVGRLQPDYPYLGEVHTPPARGPRARATPSPRVPISAMKGGRAASMTPRPLGEHVRVLEEGLRLNEQDIIEGNEDPIDISALLPDLSDIEVAAPSTTFLRTPSNDHGQPTETAVLADEAQTQWIHADVEPASSEDKEGQPEIIAVKSPANRVPTSQRIVSSTARPRKSHEALEYATPNPESDDEDRLLLRPVQPVIKRSPSPDMLIPPQLTSPPRSVAVDTRRSTREQTVEDSFLVDADGSPLEPDSTYCIPRNHVSQRSMLHGQVDGQSTVYSRISGRRKWSKTEELLLYRTVQKVPMAEEYPLRVVWYLHGEFGVLSQDLEWFNPQHMKDKMRVIVNARLNQGREVNGRARFFLPSGSRGKEEFALEVAEAQRLEKLRIKGQMAARLKHEGETEDSDEMSDGEDDDDDDQTKRAREASFDADDMDVLRSDASADEAEYTPRKRRRVGRAAKGRRSGMKEDDKLYDTHRRRAVVVEIPKRRPRASTADANAVPATNEPAQRRAFARRTGVYTSGEAASDLPTQRVLRSGRVGVPRWVTRDEVEAEAEAARTTRANTASKPKSHKKGGGGQGKRKVKTKGTGKGKASEENVNEAAPPLRQESPESEEGAGADPGDEEADDPGQQANGDGRGVVEDEFQVVRRAMLRERVMRGA